MGSTPTASMRCPQSILLRFFGQEDWEGDNGNGVASEYGNKTDTEGGWECVCDFLKVVLHPL